jgi:hypothetical protein
LPASGYAFMPGYRVSLPRGPARRPPAPADPRLVRTADSDGRSVSAGWKPWRGTQGKELAEAEAESSGTAVVEFPGDTQILITRDFDAPCHLVHEA